MINELMTNNIEGFRQSLLLQVDKLDTEWVNLSTLYHSNATSLSEKIKIRAAAKRFVNSPEFADSTVISLPLDNDITIVVSDAKILSSVYMYAYVDTTKIVISSVVLRSKEIFMFMIAHELGHKYFDHASKPDSKVKRILLSSIGIPTRDEIVADCFALGVNTKMAIDGLTQLASHTRNPELVTRLRLAIKASKRIA